VLLHFGWAGPPPLAAYLNNAETRITGYEAVITSKRLWRERHDTRLIGVVEQFPLSRAPRPGSDWARRVAERQCHGRRICRSVAQIGEGANEPAPVAEVVFHSFTRMVALQ
jgi:hypothetical protein